MAALPNTQKPTQRGCPNEETKKHVPNERAEKNLERELNKMETSNLLDAEFKTLITRMLNELRGKQQRAVRNIDMELENIFKRTSKK